MSACSAGVFYPVSDLEYGTASESFEVPAGAHEVNLVRSNGDCRVSDPPQGCTPPDVLAGAMPLFEAGSQGFLLLSEEWNQGAEGIWLVSEPSDGTPRHGETGTRVRVAHFDAAGWLRGAHRHRRRTAPRLRLGHAVRRNRQRRERACERPRRERALRKGARMGPARRERFRSCCWATGAMLFSMLLSLRTNDLVMARALERARSHRQTQKGPKLKAGTLLRFAHWCRRRDSNPHEGLPLRISSIRCVCHSATSAGALRPTSGHWGALAWRALSRCFAQCLAPRHRATNSHAASARSAVTAGGPSTRPGPACQCTSPLPFAIGWPSRAVPGIDLSIGGGMEDNGRRPRAGVRFEHASHAGRVRFRQSYG